MNTDELKAILENVAASPEQKERARAALGLQRDPTVMHDETRALLAALKISRVADLNEDVWERYCAVHRPKQTDPIVTEFWYWNGPPSFLLGMSARDWWELAYRLGAKAGREDVKAFARRKLEI